jgi:hypothetical protein
MLNALLLCSIPLSCIAILLSCVSIAVVVGLKNSTHKIEWKTYNPYDEEDEKPVVKKGEPEEELDGESMLNPNRKIPRQAPFVPFPTEPTEEEPFVDAEDPNNIVHDF